jgi:uncharacterized protein
MADANTRGRFVWYQLFTTDPKGAEPFYKDIVGWGVSRWGMGPLAYTMWTRGSSPLGGLMPLPDEAKEAGLSSHWLPFIGVTDVNGTVEQAKGLGAKVHKEPTSLPMIGRFAVLGDPQGAVFAVFAPSMPIGHDGPPKVGEFSWHELETTDHAAAFAFYEALLGWQKTELVEGPSGPYQMFGRDGQSTGGVFDSPRSGVRPHWVPYVRVEDVNASVEKVKGKGGQVLLGPIQVPGGDHVAPCVDPQGAEFAVHQVKKA